MIFFLNLLNFLYLIPGVSAQIFNSITELVVPIGIPTK